MTREEQRALRELEKSWKTACKEAGKRRGILEDARDCCAARLGEAP